MELHKSNSHSKASDGLLLLSFRVHKFACTTWSGTRRWDTQYCIFCG